MKWKRTLLSALLCVALVSPAVTCSAQQVYQVTEQEMLLLKNKLTEAKTQQAQSLTLCRQQSQQIAALKVQSQTLETQLETLNKSFVAWSKEEKSKQNKLRIQRTIAYVVALGSLMVAIAR